MRERKKRNRNKQQRPRRNRDPFRTHKRIEHLEVRWQVLLDRLNELERRVNPSDDPPF